MTNALDRLPSGARLAIIRLRSLGDCVLTTPALRLLKQARPDLAIAIVVEDRFAAVFADNPDVDQILPPNSVALSRLRPSLALNFHGGATSVRLMLAAASGLRAGFSHFRFQPMYNIHIPRAQEILGLDRKVHTAEHLASAMFYLGVRHTDIPRARLFAEPASRTHPFVIIHPFASAVDKTWPAENFIRVARHFETNGFEPIFIGGTTDDLSTFAEYTCFRGAPIGQVKSLIAGCALFVGNDSGPAHIAAAFGRPVLVLWGASDLDNWRPWRTENIVLQHSNGIGAIELPGVLNAIEKLTPSAVPYQPA